MFLFLLYIHFLRVVLVRLLTYFRKSYIGTNSILRTLIPWIQWDRLLTISFYCDILHICIMYFNVLNLRRTAVLYLWITANDVKNEFVLTRCVEQRNKDLFDWKQSNRCRDFFIYRWLISPVCDYLNWKLLLEIKAIKIRIYDILNLFSIIDKDTAVVINYSARQTLAKLAVDRQ